VTGGATQQFAATVNGTNSPSQTVTWSLTGVGALSASGLYTAPAATSSAQSATVKATASDGAHSGTATVTVPATGAAPAQQITVNTPATQTSGQSFNVTGTYANGTPTALDYRRSDDPAGQWTQVATATISGGTFSFSIAAGSATAGRTISVRDRTTGVSGTSGSYVVNAAAATVHYDYLMYYNQPVNSTTAVGKTVTTANVKGAGNDSGGVPYSAFSAMDLINNIYVGAKPAPAKMYVGWSHSPTTPPSHIIDAGGQQTGANAKWPDGYASIPGTGTLADGYQYYDISVAYAWVPTGSSGNLYLHFKPDDSDWFCVNPTTPASYTA
jgi:hypothetical protein